MRRPGRYEALQPIGTGPYAAVVLARDAFDGRKLVALKVLDPKALPVRALTRLQREFLLRRGLRHPHIAALFDLDFDEAGRCRLASEHAGGPDFVTAVGELGPDALVELSVQVLQALGHLHDCGLVHGALKPTNVRLAHQSGQPCVKLLDFDLRPGHEATPTDPASVLRYAAPEVLRGQAPDARSDLYGVGMLMLQAISGTMPFPDPEHGPGVVAWHLSRNGPRVPADHVLGAVVERLLDPDPASRFASTHEAVRAISVAAGRRFPSRSARGAEQVLITGRFIGRERELKRLSGACRRILNGGGAQVLVVVGPAGCGKSRLLDECFVAARASGIRIVQVVCRGERAAPLGALRELLHQLLVFVGSEHPVVEAHEAVLREVLPDAFPESAAPRRFDEPEYDWMRIKNGVAEFLAAMAQLRPLVVMLDDVQRIDEASLAVLRWVVQHFSACPIMLIGSVEERELDDARARASRLIESEAHEVLRLNPLGAADVEQILSGVLALDGNVRELAGLVLQLTCGVPLYLEEVVRSLLDGQMLDVLAAGTLATPDDSPSRAGELARGLVSSRIDRLPGDAQLLLSTLALYDGNAGEAELRAASGLSEGAAHDALRRLSEADLVHTEPTVRGVVVSIRSSLYREAALRRLPAGEIASMHDGMVARLETMTPGSLEATAALAYHAARGSRPAAALAWCERAAREAMALHACDRAKSLLDRARRVASELGDVEASTRTTALLAEAMVRMGEPESALVVLNDLASSDGAGRADVVHARIRMAQIQAARGRCDAARRALDLVAPDVVLLGDPVATSRFERERALLLARAGSLRPALALLERVRALLDPGNASSDLPHVLAEMGDVCLLLDDPTTARRFHRDSLARFLARRDRSGVALAHLNLGRTEWCEGRAGSALARLRRCERLARRLGFHPLLGRSLLESGGIEAVVGKLGDAVRTLTQGVQLMRRLGDDGGICEGLSRLAGAHFATGRHEMARMLIEDVVARRGRLNDLSGVASARVMLGRVLGTMGALDDAETLLRTAADAAEQLLLPEPAVQALEGLAVVALERGRVAEARALLDRLRRAEGVPRGPALLRSELIRAEIAIRTGGEPHLRRRIAGVLRRARARRDAASAVEALRLAGRARGDPSGVASLRAALRVAERIGLRELAWRIRADLGMRHLENADVAQAVEVMKEAMILLRGLHDELPVRRRDAYLADPRKQALRAAFHDAVDRLGVPVA